MSQGIPGGMGAMQQQLMMNPASVRGVATGGGSSPVLPPGFGMTGPSASPGGGNMIGSPIGPGGYMGGGGGAVQPGSMGAMQQQLMGAGAMPQQQQGPAMMHPAGMVTGGMGGPMQGGVAGGPMPQSYPAVQRLSAMAGPPQIHGMYQPPQAGAAVRAFPGMMPTYHPQMAMPPAPMGMLQRPQLSGMPLRPAASINPALLYNPNGARVTPQTAQPALPTAQGINPAQLYGVGPSLGSLRAGVGGATLSDARQKRKLSLREILGR